LPGPRCPDQYDRDDFKVRRLLASITIRNLDEIVKHKLPLPGDRPDFA
jgi:hypothetical protein